MLKAIKSVFLCILLNKNYWLKAELMETKYVYGELCYALNLIERNIFLINFLRRRDQSSPADFVVLQRPWRALKNVLKLP